MLCAIAGYEGDLQKPVWQDDLARDCLGEYCQYLYKGEPLFRTFGNDSTFYGPPTANQLRWYPNQIPEGFEMCCKVWEEITIPTYAPASLRAKAGQPNPRFLDADAFRQGRYTPRHRCW